MEKGMLPTSLTHLTLGCRLNREIFRWLKDTTSKLYLNEYRLEEWPKKLVGKEHLIIRLDCSNNKLTVLPEGLTNLEELNCSYNRLTMLPKGLTNLKVLDCSINNLTSLPVDLMNLEDLDCAENYLTTLPDNLINLEELDCSWNKLTSLPKGLINIECIYCYNNELTSLTSLSKTLSGSLNHLFCRMNMITIISDDFAKNLISLDCSYNNLTYIPKCSTSLQSLSCFNNRLFSNELSDWKKIWAIKERHQQKLRKNGLKKVLKNLKNRLYLPRLDKLHQELIWSPNHTGIFFTLLPRSGIWSPK